MRERDIEDCEALAPAGLEEVFGLVVPIGDRISSLADRYRSRLYQDLTD